MIAAIISKDASMRTRIESALEAKAGIESVLIIPEYPDDSEIRSLEGTGEKYIAFIDFRDNANRALALAGEINRSCPSVGAVALNVGASQSDMIAIVRAGICEVLPQPFSDRDVAVAVLNVTRKLAGGSSADGGPGIVYAFLPARPGAGASTLAVYSALACARVPDCHPLLLDFDIRFGITSFILKLDSSHSIMDAFENASRMDQTLWDQLISEREKLDVLGSGPGDAEKRVSTESFQSVLKWSRSRYTALIVDLPGMMEDFEVATLQQAAIIFLVCGPDLPSLHMARRKIQWLHSLYVVDRVSIIVNRMDKRTSLSMRDVESVLGLPIQLTVPADERSIADAVQAGTGIRAKCPFSVQIETIAKKMVGNRLSNSAVPRAKRQFVEFFSVPQSKGVDPWRL
jgi:pilus assembly protein CpaE